MDKVLKTSREEYVAFWGANRLHRWTPDVVATLEIPKASRDFLSEWGLPLGDGVVFSFDSRFDALERVAERPDLRQFGIHGFDPLCISEAMGGQVVELKGNGELVWNSSIQLFALCLVEFVASEKAALTPPPRGFKGRLDKLADRTETRMRAIDSKAFVSEDMPWPSHCESLRGDEYPDPLELEDDGDDDDYPDSLKG